MQKYHGFHTVARHQLAKFSRGIFTAQHADKSLGYIQVFVTVNCAHLPGEIDLVTGTIKIRRNLTTMNLFVPPKTKAQPWGTKTTRLSNFYRAPLECYYQTYWYSSPQSVPYTSHLCLLVIISAGANPAFIAS